MLQYFSKKLFNPLIWVYGYVSSFGADLQKGDNLAARGQYLLAIAEFKKYLRRYPHNCSVLLALGGCYEQIGNKQQSHEINALAYALDDTFIPAIYKRANNLIDANMSDEAMPLLLLVKDVPVVGEGVNSLLSGICMNRGDAYKAKEFQLNAWLANFDELRNANCYLFRLAYNDSDEMLLAQEHQFWAETRQPVPDIDAPKKEDIINGNKKQVKKQEIVKRHDPEKMRIGYWGCDFREHSVRYFSRPLIANHNTDKFEIYIYNENFLNLPDDKQTAAFRALTDDFYDVNMKPDNEVETLIRSHNLDILVDLAGHTSSNRLHLLKNKLAKVQVTGLAYPPTTGIKSIDVKLMDRHIYTPEANQYYSENPLVLPGSLWCFDPMEEIPYSKEPPILKNGYITFGCFGNVAKITTPILNCWNLILSKIPTSKLIIQSPTFNDRATLDSFRNKILKTGIDASQVELRGPTFGGDFWATYKEIDIILDTYPFNGGTTSCYAAYAGVPILTLAGKSLISRVGRSIMFNLGYPDWVVESVDDYVERAISFSQNVKLLINFRVQARELFINSSLGNGKKFAQEFESACEELLAQKQNGSLISHSCVPALPVDILLTRAQTVWYYGNFDASQRILKECMRHYPANGGAYLLQGQQLMRMRHHLEAIEILTNHFSSFNETQAHDALLLLARIQWMLGNADLAVQALQRQQAMGAANLFHKAQAQLLQMALKPLQALPIQQLSPSFKRSILVLISSGESTTFEEIQSQVQATCTTPKGWDVAYSRCHPADRLAAYNEAIGSAQVDILIVMQRNLKVYNQNFFIDVAMGLEDCDLLGCAGALRWTQKDWSLDLPEFKAWGMMRPSVEADNFVELQIAGTSQQKIVPNAVVLDGKFLALKPSQLSGIEFDEDLSDTQWLAEEDWSNRVHLAGHRVSIHRNLGLFINESLETHPMNTTQGQRGLIERLKLDPFALSIRDFTALSVPVQSASYGFAVADTFLK